MKEMTCSFCGKTQSEVRKLVSSPDGMSFICDTCVDICKEIVKEQESRVTRSKFSLPTPMELKNYLDQYIVGQDSAKRALSVAVYNHYKRLNHNFSTKSDRVELDKSNVLMIGPTGVGKTLIARTLARILKVPFASVDATTLTEAGYVGDDVESVLSKLLANAEYDIKRAEMGIVYIDEIDKIAKKPESRSLSRDVSGEGVQQALLKILEGSIASVPVSCGRKHPHQETVEMNTNNILFICGGAFVKLGEIIAMRNKCDVLGFNKTQKADPVQDYKFAKQVRPADLVEFGLIPEFVGRLPIVVGLDDLDENALINILTTPKNSLISQFQTIFKMDGIDLKFEPDALKEIAKRAKDLKVGARGLRTVMEEAMLDIMFDAPSNKTTNSIVLSSKNLKPVCGLNLKNNDYNNTKVSVPN
ncbi:MAG: ATP-dependent Clp protease ATP-binding subunit ClpX [Clostridia bacterium]|nr:ATP-dependent Clp protease ATP-binding subunit ClpX [Clostridia bacterium]